MGESRLTALPSLSPGYDLDLLKTKVQALFSHHAPTLDQSDTGRLAFLGSVAIDYIIPAVISNQLGADWSPTTLKSIKTEILSTASIARMAADNDLLNGLLPSANSTDISSETLTMVFHILVGWIHQDSQLALLQPWITGIFTPTIQNSIQNLPNHTQSTIQQPLALAGFTFAGASSSLPGHTAPLSPSTTSTICINSLTPPSNILMIFNETLTKHQLTEKVRFTESRLPDLKWKFECLLMREDGNPLVIGTAADAKKKDAKGRAAQNALRILRQRGEVI